MTHVTGDADEGRPLTQPHDAATPEVAAPQGEDLPVVVESMIPPRPPLPKGADFSADPAAAVREQLRQARGEFEIHVTQAREHLDHANERIKARTGRDLILAILVGLGFGAVLLGSLMFIKELFVPIALGIAVLGVFE